MKKFLTRAIAGAALLGLGACASNWDIDGVAAMQNPGDAFTKALQTRYLERARFEKGESDWYDVAYFTEKARQAGTGLVTAPQHPSERGLAGNAEVKSAYEKLMAALATTAPKDAPDSCALAQTWFDHWMEQLQEGFQADHIAEAKSGFDKAMPLCVAKVVVKPTPQKMVHTYLVFFDLGKATLSKEAKNTLAMVAKDNETFKPSTIYLAGHTDTVGSAASNEKLAIKRTETVAKELANMGIATKTLDMKSLGETMLAVPTKDNTSEMRNRRVEIRMEKMQ
ncbi:MAG: OmpA family protein [Magnetospirillum gryphiswaldense]|nr:OmpA family protein [Magnetospirillum gryphiswaldense]